jgi:hypothetical protein
MERYIHTDIQSDMAFFSAYAIISFALRARNKLYLWGDLERKGVFSGMSTSLLARLHLNNVFLLSIFDVWIYILVIHGTLNVHPNVTSFYVNF